MMFGIAGPLSSCCPFCKSIDFRSVDARNSVERTFCWLLQPYRCSLCGHHFFLFRWHTPIESEA